MPLSLPRLTYVSIHIAAVCSLDTATEVLKPGIKKDIMAAVEGPAFQLGLWCWADLSQIHLTGDRHIYDKT